MAASKGKLGPIALIAATVGLLVAAFALAAGWIGPRRVSGGDTTDAIVYNSGAFPGYRRAHAKGICFAGRFEANGAGSTLTTAAPLQTGRYPVIGRFSINPGNPFASDAMATFHSMALLLRLPDGQQWRMAMDHVPIFPVADAASFVALQRASKPDPRTGKPDPALMGPYLVAHPETKAFLDYMGKAVVPDSFANGTYYSINAFRFTDGQGVSRLVRWQFEPETPLVGIDKAQLAKLPRDHLFREFYDRTRKTPSRWHLQLMVANPGDVTDKATVAWTGPHRTIEAGTLVIDRAAPEETGACRDYNFDPTILPAGIAVSDDPLLGARSKTYSSSFIRRAQAGPKPSALGEDLHTGEKP